MTPLNNRLPDHGVPWSERRLGRAEQLSNLRFASEHADVVQHLMSPQLYESFRQAWRSKGAWEATCLLSDWLDNEQIADQVRDLLISSKPRRAKESDFARENPLWADLI